MSETNARRMIAVDWGTSNFRAFLIDRDTGECLASHRSDAGLRALASREFPHYCAAQVGQWRAAGGGERHVPIYLAGMVGSKRGWAEAPQLDLPVSADDLAHHVMAAPGLENAWIVPGVKVVRDEHVDVMRGEEIQAFGALSLAGQSDALCCLPGTHSKWARLEAERLVDFSTTMTGELYHAVRFHTLPGEPSRESADFDAEAFRQGVRAASHPGGVLHALFEARSRHLYAGLEREQVGSFLSGVLIGSEVITQRSLHAAGTRVLLVGARDMNRLYRRVLEECDFTVEEIDSDAASLAGLRTLAQCHEELA